MNINHFIFIAVPGIPRLLIVIVIWKLPHLPPQSDQAKEVYLLEKRNHLEEDLLVMKMKVQKLLMKKLGGNVEVWTDIVIILKLFLVWKNINLVFLKKIVTNSVDFKFLTVQYFLLTIFFIFFRYYIYLIYFYS